MIRIVLDTNVFVSGLFWTGIPYQILEAWTNKKLQIVYSQDIMKEYARIAHALARKHNACRERDISEALELVAIHAELVIPVLLDKQICSDRDDDKFIACALGANCNTIISGDKHLLEVLNYEGIHILKPAEFWNLK